jgi:GAF domain-containing protein
MTATLDGEVADLRRAKAELQQRLDEALAREAATAEVLQVINSSPGELRPVFEAMLDKATLLSEAAFGVLWTYDGELFHAMAFRNVPPAFAEFLREPQKASPITALGRIALGEPLAHIPDIAADEYYRLGGLLAQSGFALAGFRTMLAVPMRKHDVLLGAVTIYRKEVRLFADKQIALLQNSLRRPVAMENAAHHRDARGIEQQTATAEGVISSIPHR